MDMIEKVARAIYDREWEEGFPVPGTAAHALAMDMARAAIMALREIPDEIEDAARGLWIFNVSQKMSGFTIGKHNAAGGYKLSLTPEEAELDHLPKHVCGRIAWRTMIDACLNPPPAR